MREKGNVFKRLKNNNYSRFEFQVGYRRAFQVGCRRALNHSRFKARLPLSTEGVVTTSLKIFVRSAKTLLFATEWLQLIVVSSFWGRALGLKGRSRVALKVSDVGGDICLRS